MSVHLLVASPIAGCLGRETIAACLEPRGMGTDDPSRVTCAGCLAVIADACANVDVVAARPGDETKALRLQNYLRWRAGKVLS